MGFLLMVENAFPAPQAVFFATTLRPAWQQLAKNWSVILSEGWLLLAKLSSLRRFLVSRAVVEILSPHSMLLWTE